MTNAPTKLSFSEIMTEAVAVSKDVQASFGNMSGRQLNWKPGADQWSIGQCLDHLITANEGYFPQFDQIIRGEKRTTFWQSMPFLPGFFGRMLINTISPDSKRKFSAPKIFQPSSSDIDPQIISRFIEHQAQVIEKMKATNGKDLEGVIIYSPVTKVITYSLLDAYRVVVLHERRHIKQAQGLLDAPGFPR